jgi:hypothetical protein
VGFFLQAFDRMGERRLVQIMQRVAQFFVAGPPWSESGPVGLTQRANERIAMLPAEVTILVSMTVP